MFGCFGVSHQLPQNHPRGCPSTESTSKPTAAHCGGPFRQRGFARGETRPDLATCRQNRSRRAQLRALRAGEARPRRGSFHEERHALRRDTRQAGSETGPSGRQRPQRRSCISPVRSWPAFASRVLHRSMSSPTTSPMPRACPAATSRRGVDARALVPLDNPSTKAEAGTGSGLLSLDTIREHQHVLTPGKSGSGGDVCPRFPRFVTRFSPLLRTNRWSTTRRRLGLRRTYSSNAPGAIPFVNCLPGP
jgi:hypothetical protein